MSQSKRIAILGGGPAGLAAGYFARKRNLPFTVYEADRRVGGNAVTLRQGGFRFDSGTHRFDDLDLEITAEVGELLRGDLLSVDDRFRVVRGDTSFDFPLSPMKALTKLGPGPSIAAGLARLRAMLTVRDGDRGIREAVVRGYESAVAEGFAFDYFEKLWGLPVERGSERAPGAAAGGRAPLPLLEEMLGGVGTRRPDRSRSSCYPRHGYGQIVSALAAKCGSRRIRLNSPARRLVHDGQRIVALELADGIRVEPSVVIATIPLGDLMRALDPRPPAHVTDAARGLRFRNLILAAFLLDQERVTPNGAVYFADRGMPVTRVSEPKNRSSDMAPVGRTSLIAELPCGPSGPPWDLTDDEIVNLIQPHLERIGFVESERLIGRRVHRVPHAFPLLERGGAQRIESLLEYLRRFENLRVLGHGRQHGETRLQDQLRQAKTVIDTEVLSRSSSWRRPPRVSPWSVPGPVGVHPASPP